jgi:hypothetical protein
MLLELGFPQSENNRNDQFLKKSKTVKYIEFKNELEADLGFSFSKI